jgi:hypothetical protein
MSSIYEKIFQSDEEKVFATYTIPSEYKGDIIVHVDKPKQKKVSENHNLLKLYEWGQQSKKYVKITPGEFIKNKKYKSYTLISEKNNFLTCRQIV